MKFLVKFAQKSALGLEIWFKLGEDSNYTIQLTEKYFNEKTEWKIETFRKIHIERLFNLGEFKLGVLDCKVIEKTENFDGWKVWTNKGMCEYQWTHLLYEDQHLFVLGAFQVALVSVSDVDLTVYDRTWVVDTGGCQSAQHAFKLSYKSWKIRDLWV